MIAAQSSPLLVDEAQGEAIAKAELDRIVEETFDAERRTIDGQRLLDTAWVADVLEPGRLGPMIYATAAALLDETRPAAAIPWARAAVVNWVRPNVVDHHDHDH